MRFRLRRICSFFVFIFLPAQLMVIIGVHYINRKDESLPPAANKATELKISADETPGLEHGAMEVFTELQRKWDTKKDLDLVRDLDDKEERDENNNGLMKQHERKLSHILREGTKEKDNHTVHLPPLIKSQTPILINQTKAAIDQLKKSRDRLFSDAIGPSSDSQCMIPNMDTPAHTCREYIQWKCKMVPTFTSYDPVNRLISVTCKGMFRVNQVERVESEYALSPDNYRQPPFWEYYEGVNNITMETEYADIACKDKLFQDVHNYHTQFQPRPGIDWLQGNALRTIRLKEPQWKPVSILTIVLDSTSRAHFHRRCGLPKTAALLRKYYEGMTSGLSHQSFMFNRFNGISTATVLNLTPLFTGQLYDHVDEEKIRQKIYGKDIKEWMWQYAESRGYLTSYGVDNGSGMMGTRTQCKACLYRPPVLPHIEHGWKRRENERVSTTTLSGLCEGNHMIHEYILNYTRDFLRHPHPAKWAALDLNAGHRREMESVNQVDNELSKVLQTLLDEDKNLVVVLLGDHGKPFQKDPSYIGSHYETLLPFLSVTMPTWMLRQRPDVFRNLAINQQRYLPWDPGLLRTPIG
ncbi:uncharacterized protein LOC100890537 [Strongylocentrotus purpuratus]|uniref:Uncharacterized protein n=1 Tax=Strongylocentrotus purpuratus TaxID=7668 RepID=A0A7M7P1M8_STRPU|nr:uncharacterized protein LOC100890537 [Strongylocentrotus purpuratus]